MKIAKGGNIKMNFVKKNGAGLLLCLIIAVPSWFLGQALPVIGGPVFAILIGMILTLILTKKEPFTAQCHLDKITIQDLSVRNSTGVFF